MSREDLEIVLNALVPLAQRELKEHGSFPPMAAALDDKGELEVQIPGPGEGGETDELLALLVDSLRKGLAADGYRTVGWCVEVEAERPGGEEPVDAIAVHLESPTETLMAFVPFVLGEDGDVAYSDTFFGAADPVVFEESGEEAS